VRFPITRHRLPQLAADLAIVVAAWFLAFQLRFDPSIPVYYERYLDAGILALLVAIKLSVFSLFGFYNRWWRYVSTRDMWGAFRGVTAASLVSFLVFSFFDVHVVAVPRLRGCSRGRSSSGRRPRRSSPGARKSSSSARATRPS